MDIEGMELEALKGSRACLNTIDRIVVEWHDERTKRGLIKLLGEHQFAVLHEEPRRYGNIYFQRVV